MKKCVNSDVYLENTANPRISRVERHRASLMFSFLPMKVNYLTLSINFQFSV